MESDFLTKGQLLAIEQLSDIASVSNGAIEIVELTPPSSQGASMMARLSWAAGEYEKAVGGFAFRKREPLIIYIPSRFPIAVPSANFMHTRFMGQPHVQWVNHLCLYQATDVEWTANDGMFGFIKRLNQWLQDAALNQLDPNDAPLHPPIAYTSIDQKKLSIEVDPPEILEDKSYWIGTAKLTKRNNICFDLTEWDNLPGTLPEGERYAAALLLNQPMPMEYPDTVLKLISALQERGIPFELLFSILKIFSLCQQENEPLYFVLGAPMRRRASGEPLKQHLSAWSIEPKYVAALRGIVRDQTTDEAEESWKNVLEWATEAKTEWCRVYENRPEVTFRRDKGTSANWFIGKSIALLGCGAIGSHIGEYVVRAGATKVQLVDNSTVNPGILVRQQFENWQVGYTKQSALKLELAAINPKADIDHLYADLKEGWPSSLTVGEFDLIIDATASRRVAAALQLAFETVENIPPILRSTISGHASHGIATLKMKNSQFGPADIIRQTKLVASSKEELYTFSKAFWPKEQLQPGFQPEPGCSEPTFVGSAADVAFFASSFFCFAADAITSVPNG